MSDDELNELEDRLREAGRAFPYPLTPDLVVALRRRRSNHAPRRRLVIRIAAIVAVMVVALLAVPDVRAAVLAALRIGVIQIVPAAPTAAVPVQSAGAPTQAIPPPAPTATLPPDALLRDLRGATTLDAARAQLPFPLRLPAEPPGLGPPTDVFVQDLGGPAAILVWRDSADPQRPQLALFILSSDVFGAKLGVSVLEETQVNGRQAVWASGPYVLQLGDAQRWTNAERRLVTGNTLIWEEDGLTYRLESDLPLEEAVRIAESLR